MTKIAYLFSGQGSQYVGMGEELCAISAGARQVFERASEVLGFDLRKRCAEAGEAALAQTGNAQPGIMAVSLAAAAALKEAGISAQAVAGHSLGEYAALVVSGALTFENGFRVIKARAAAMQACAEKQDGMMCAILGAPPEKVEEICAGVDGYVVPVNYNSPVQTVIAGETPAVQAAIEAFSGVARRCAPLKVSAAFHSKLMQPAADEFLAAISDIPFGQPTIPFYCNYTGKLLSPDADIKMLLGLHLVSPVRFTDELAAMQADGIDTYIELGPGKVLAGLVKKTLKGVRIAGVENEKTLQAAKELLTEAE